MSSDSTLAVQLSSGEIVSKIPLFAIVGPTASGKTALAVSLAQQLHDTIVSEAIAADSRQIYRLMDVATAKPTPDECAALPHHLLDVVWPDESYTLANYQADANAAIAAVSERGHLPVLVGGTGLYVRAVVDGLAIPAVAPMPDLRAELEREAAEHGAESLHARLSAVDPAAAANIDPHNVRRLVRALEVCLVTGRPFSEQQGARPTPYKTLMLGLTMDRTLLYARADARVDAMLSAGVVEEAQALVARGYSWALPSMSSLGYREIGAYLRGEMTLEQVIERLKLDTHAYIRRQLTWFRPDQRIHWLDAALPLSTLTESALAVIQPWLASSA
jgi:tRNA dimethylallyltransferase